MATKKVMLGTTLNGENTEVNVTDYKLEVKMDSDIQIGAVEIKDETSNDRANVVTRLDGKKALCVQHNADIQIGAVEIKNATDDTRTVVKSDGTDNALVVTNNNIVGKSSSLSPSKVSVDQNSTQILAANTSRKKLIIVNNGSEKCYISGSAATDNDFPLYPGASIDDQSIGIYTGAIYGVCDTGKTTDIRVLESA